MYFVSDLSGLYTSNATTVLIESNDTVVPLRYCVVGEEALEQGGHQFCSPCSEGFLSLDNTSSCLQCATELDCVSGGCPVQCPGGDTFVAQHCGRDTQCLLQRSYTCEQEDACTTGGGAETCAVTEPGNSNRISRGASGVADLALCDPAFAGSSVVLCGSGAPVTCAEDHFPNLLSNGCLKCSSRFMILAGFIALGTAVMILLAIVLYVLYRSMRTEQFKRGRQAAVDAAKSGEAQATSVELLKAKNAVSLVVGYVQVIGQLTSIFRSDLIPREVARFTSNFLVMNLDIPMMTNFSCFSYYYLPELARGSAFMFTFYQSVATPLVVCILFASIYLFVVCSYQHQRKNERRRDLQPDNQDLQLDDTPDEGKKEMEKHELVPPK
eukprot:gene20730-24846_t